MFFTKSLKRTVKWLCLSLSATALTLGSATPTEAGIIPWVYNAIFGPSVNGPLYGGGGMGGGYYGSSYASYGPAMYGGGCSTGACGMSYGASYGFAPESYGYGGGCGTCGVAGAPVGGCATGNCGVSYYSPMASACTPNASGGNLTPTPAAGAGTAPNAAGAGAGFTGNGFTGGAAGAATGPTGYPPNNGAGGFVPANPGTAPAGVDPYGAQPRTFAPTDPAGGRTTPDAGFRERNPMSNPALNDEETGTGFKPVTPAPTDVPANPTAAPAPVTPETRAPAIREDDASVDPMSDSDKHVASRAFQRMTMQRTLKDARLARGPAPAVKEPLAAQVAKR